MCKDALQRLIDIGLVLQIKSQADENVDHKLEVTQLGRATFKGTVNPEIFANSIKRHIWDTKNLRLGHDFPITVNDRMI